MSAFGDERLPALTFIDHVHPLTPKSLTHLRLTNSSNMPLLVPPLPLCALLV